MSQRVGFTRVRGAWFIGAVCMLAACSKASSAATSEAAATGSKPAIIRKVLQRTPTTSDRELRLMFIEYPPGAMAPAHRHPAVGLCYVLEGTAESQYEGEQTRTLHAGDSYQDSATRPHLLWKNPSSTTPLRFICSAELGKNQEFSIPI